MPVITTPINRDLAEVKFMVHIRDLKLSRVFLLVKLAFCSTALTNLPHVFVFQSNFSLWWTLFHPVKLASGWLLLTSIECKAMFRQLNSKTVYHAIAETTSPFEEISTSGDLKPGDSLFCIKHPPQTINDLQPHPLPPLDKHKLTKYPNYSMCVDVCGLR